MNCDLINQLVDDIINCAKIDNLLNLTKKSNSIKIAEKLFNHYESIFCELNEEESDELYSQLESRIWNMIN